MLASLQILQVAAITLVAFNLLTRTRETLGIEYLAGDLLHLFTKHLLFWSLIMSNLLSIVDVILSALEITDKIVRGGLGVSFWVIGRIVSALTSRTAKRIYAAIIGAIIYACQSAIESGRIVGEGYHSVDVVEVVPSVETIEPTQRLLCGSKPQPILCGSKTPLLLAPAVDVVDVVNVVNVVNVVEPIGFMESLMAIADPAITPRLDHLSLVQLRSLGRFHQIKGASRWKKAEAIAALSAA